MLEICEVEKFCTLKHCKDPDYFMYIGPHNCTCRGCLLNTQKAINNDNKDLTMHCEFSGDGYNTDLDCLMDK